MSLKMCCNLSQEEDDDDDDFDDDDDESGSPDSLPLEQEMLEVSPDPIAIKEEPHDL
jgi:hypothetical protein